MEESDKDRRSTELDESDHFSIEEEVSGDGPQLATESHIEVDRCALDIREGSSVGATEEARECYESEQIPQQKVKQCEKTKQNVSVELSGVEYEGIVDECRKERAAIEYAEKPDDAASEDESGASKTKELCIVARSEVILENAMEHVPVVSARISLGDEEITACEARGQDVPGIVELGLEGVELHEQKLPLQEAKHIVELVLEEAVICDARQQMEEARDIEEPQKYAFRGKESDDDD